MKKLYFAAVLAFLLYPINKISAQRFDQLDKYPVDISYLRPAHNKSPLIKVVYSRPVKKNDQVFGEQVPFDKLWRTGANEATEIKFYSDVKLGNKIIKTGTYTLQTIPGEKEWTIILNAKTDTWGTVFYDPSKDVVRIKVPVKHGKPIDIFSIAFKKQYNETYMVLAWDTARINVPIEMNSQILAEL